MDMEEVVDLCRQHLWLSDSPPCNEIQNDLSGFNQLARAFGAETILQIIPPACGRALERTFPTSTLPRRADGRVSWR